MLEAKARPGRGQAKAKSAKTSDYRVLERELQAKVVSGIWTAESIGCFNTAHESIDDKT